MNIQKRLDALKQEVGKPRLTRGAKVKAVAIQFEELFRKTSFNSEEFSEWQKKHPVLANLSPSSARERLQAAGYRDDMPHSFEIIRIAKSQWKLRPVEDLIFSGDISKFLISAFKKTENKLQKTLQACDLDSQNLLQRFTIVSTYRQFKHMKEMMLLQASAINDLVLPWIEEENDLLPLANLETSQEEPEE
jgi:hypothetical protein